MVKYKDSDARPYHHGDLRRVIVTAALEILNETQSVDFSLRELARRAGVSHSAPYKHFAQKSELLAALSAAGFELLTERIAGQIAHIGNPRAQLFVILRTYIRCGVENPALYRLMFGGYLSGPDSSRPAIERAGPRRCESSFSARLRMARSDSRLRVRRAMRAGSPALSSPAGRSCTGSLC